MAVKLEAVFFGSMASPWRRRRLCTISSETLPSAQAALIAVSGRGAEVATSARPTMGTAVDLWHPEAGRIVGRVVAYGGDGVRIAFDETARAVAFALAVTVADMSVGALNRA